MWKVRSLAREKQPSPERRQAERSLCSCVRRAAHGDPLAEKHFYPTHLTSLTSAGSLQSHGYSPVLRSGSQPVWSRGTSPSAPISAAGAAPCGLYAQLLILQGAEHRGDWKDRSKVSGAFWGKDHTAEPLNWALSL